MTEYLLDTDSLIFLLKQNPGIEAKVQEVGISAIALSVITVAEVLYGAYNSANPSRSLDMTRKLTNQFKVLELTQSIANKFGEIKADLRGNGQLISDFDMLIGATAIIAQRTLVTNNVSEFNRLATFGLIIENWKS